MGREPPQPVRDTRVLSKQGAKEVAVALDGRPELFECDVPVAVDVELWKASRKACS